MKYSIVLFLSLLLACQASPPSIKKEAQPRPVGGPCEGCEAVLEYGSKVLKSVDTLPFFQKARIPLEITGTVLQLDGKTPARNVMLYLYHTDEKGLYSPAEGASGWARRHGERRGWLKTDADGRYTFYTARPAAYPNGGEPEHLHIFLKEPQTTPYYIDDFVFDDDPLLTEQKRRQLINRGGSGIVRPQKQESGIFRIERNIILGLNIPNYD